MALDINWIALVIIALIKFTIHFFWYFPFAFGNLRLKFVGKESEIKSKTL